MYNNLRFLNYRYNNNSSFLNTSKRHNTHIATCIPIFEILIPTFCFTFKLENPFPIFYQIQKPLSIHFSLTCQVDQTRVSPCNIWWTLFQPRPVPPEARPLHRWGFWREVTAPRGEVAFRAPSTRIAPIAANPESMTHNVMIYEYVYLIRCCKYFK